MIVNLDLHFLLRSLNHKNVHLLLYISSLLQHSERPQCVFVRTTGSTGMEWSDQGCKVKAHVTGSHTDCECNHMTNFALLMVSMIYKDFNTECAWV